MTNVVVTGGAGFLGARLARELLATGTLAIAGGAASRLGRLTLIDRVPVPEDIAAHRLVTAISGDLPDLLDPARGGPGRLSGADVIFHLAAAVSAECEADFDLGMRANLVATQRLLACCRAAGTSPVVVFASSIAAFGGSDDHRLPAVVDDQTMPNPQSSYGTQKVIGEQLVADYTRKGYLRGRAVRLMTVVVRPGGPNAAASGFLSSIIREPLRGERAICPVSPDTAAAIASPARAIEGLLRAAADMVSALERAAGREAAALIDWEPDPAIARIVTSWPSAFRTDRAARLGLTPDENVDSIVAQHLAETTVGPGAR